MGFSHLFDVLTSAAVACLPALLDTAIKGAALLAVAALAALTMRRSSSSARYQVWFLGTLSLLILPVLSAVLPSWYILPRLAFEAAPVPPLGVEFSTAVPIPASPAAVPHQFKSGPAAHPPALFPTVPAASGAMSIQTTWPTARLSWQTWLVFVWLAGAAAMLARAGLGCLSLWWLQRRSSRITSGEWPALIEQLCRQVGLSRPVDLLTSPWRTMPMTWGLWRTRLLLPEDAFAWTAQQRRMVLLHELAHARRWDSLTQWIAQLACALHWFNPLAWLAWRCMQTERERACDDLVLASGTLPSAYAEQLLHIAADTPVGRCSVAGIAMARPSKLEGRLLAILNDRCCRRSLTRRAIALLVVAFAAILLPIGMMRAVAVDSAVPGGPVPKTVATTTTAPQTASAPSSENTVEHARDCSRDFSVDLGGDLTLEMVWVPKGTFEMGSPPSEEGRRDNEGPLHTVHLEGFWLGKYEVTQEQYERVMGRNHALFKGPRHPVETMSWEEAVSFCDKLPKRVRQRFTLPSEAQWEYACRAGSRTRFCFGDSDTDLADYAWYVDNAQNSTRPVGQKRPNAFGLYDMHGNVFELCADDWHDDYNGAPSDGSPWLGEDRSRTGRGGCWAWPATISRSAFRDHASFINKDRRCGFRVAALPFAAAQAPADYTISGKVVDQTPDYSRLDFDKLATCKTDEELVPISRGNTITGVNIVMDRVGGDPR